MEKACLSLRLILPQKLACKLMIALPFKNLFDYASSQCETLTHLSRLGLDKYRACSLQDWISVGGPINRSRTVSCNILDFGFNLNSTLKTRS